MRNRATSSPSPAALAAHQRACAQGERMYQDPESGLYVMTSFHLASVQRCCGAGCRHCPYDVEAQRRAKRADLPSWPLQPPYRDE